MTHKSRITIAVAATLTLGLAAAQAGKKGRELVVIPAGAATYVPFNPQDPAHSPQVAVLSGDPKKGPVSFYLKTQGLAPMHWHTSDYYAVVVSGTTRHWAAGQEADKKDLGPGSFWFQPGGDKSTAHGDECVTPEGCVIYISMPKQQDFIPLMPQK